MKNAYKSNRITGGQALLSDKPERIHGLDFLRGLCIILMIFDHIAFDFMWMPHWALNFRSANVAFFVKMAQFCRTWWNSTLRIFLRLTVISAFFAISGISSSFSHNNLLRGVKLAVASTVLTLFTLLGDIFFDLGIGIVFGVLHCFTVSILLLAVLELLLGDKTKYACLGLGLLFFIWGLTFDFYQTTQAANLNGQTLTFVRYLQLMVGTRYYGADCFGVLPYGGIFLIGAYGGAQLYKKRKPYLPLFAAKPFAPVRFVGRKAVWFYLLHQPVVFCVLVGIAMCCGLRFF